MTSCPVLAQPIITHSDKYAEDLAQCWNVLLQCRLYFAAHQYSYWWVKCGGLILLFTVCDNNHFYFRMWYRTWMSFHSIECYAVLPPSGGKNPCWGLLCRRSMVLYKQPMLSELLSLFCWVNDCFLADQMYFSRCVLQKELSVFPSTQWSNAWLLS